MLERSARRRAGTLLIRRGRAYWRNQRDDHRLRWFEVPEEPDPDADNADDYDRLGMMMKIDTLDQPWRDLINEHGFTPVIKLMFEVRDVEQATQALNRRREMRQSQLAHGSY